MSATEIIFYAFSILAVVSAIGMILNVRNTVAAAMSLVVTMIALAGIYVLMGAHLVAVIQIIVYAGAIVVLFLFVVMLLNLRTDEFPPARQRWLKILAPAIGLVVLLQLLRLMPGSLPEIPPLPDGYGGYRPVGIALYTDYILVEEMVALLLLSAIVGGLIMAMRKIG